MMHTRSYLKIGLTGGIGSGKSLAAKRFAMLGASVYQADEISRHALDPGAVCYDRVVSAFGTEILCEDKTINRKLLGQIVFSDKNRLSDLNAIVHPYVINELFAMAERDLKDVTRGIAVFEVPLLFETGMQSNMDRTILVHCDEELRIQRVMQRDGLSREQILARMRAQMPEDQKRSLADFILDNNGNEEELFNQIDALYQMLKSEEPRT